MPKGPEAKIERDAGKFMHSLGGMFPKCVSPGNKGWPDRNPCHPVCGPFYMEFKRPGKSATELQLIVAQEMADKGARVYTSVNSLRMAIAIIEDEVNGVPPSARRFHPVARSK